MSRCALNRYGEKGDPHECLKSEGQKSGLKLMKKANFRNAKETLRKIHKNGQTERYKNPSHA